MHQLRKLWDMGSLTDSFNQMILLKVRLPRIIEALLTGAILNPRNIANPEPNVAPLASPNVKLSARGLFKTV
jgi:ABC-type enterobactin transport system permease subunit